MVEENAQGGTANQGGASGGSPTGQAGGDAGGQTGGTGGAILTGGAGQQGGQQGGQAGAGSTGNVLPGWLNEVSEGHRSNKMFHNIKGNTLREASEVILKNYDNAQRQLGRSIGIPQPNDPPQKRAEFERKINGYRGVPETHEGYQYEVPEVNGNPLQNEIVNDFVGKAHKMGFTNNQLQFVLNEYARVQNSGIETYRNNQKAALEQLKTEWGPNFARKAVLAHRIVREVGGQSVLDLLDQSGLGNHPVLVKFMADLGEWAAEDGFIRADIPGVQGPEDAKRRIAEIQNDPKHPYNDKKATTQAHKDAVEEVKRLHQIAYAE